MPADGRALLFLHKVTATEETDVSDQRRDLGSFDESCRQFVWSAIEGLRIDRAVSWLSRKFDRGDDDE